MMLRMALDVELRGEGDEILLTIAGDGLLERLCQYAGDDRQSDCLRWIDPYGATMFNVVQAWALASELGAMRPRLSGAEEAFLVEFLELTWRCVLGTRLYIWCVAG